MHPKKYQEKKLQDRLKLFENRISDLNISLSLSLKHMANIEKNIINVTCSIKVVS